MGQVSHGSPSAGDILPKKTASVNHQSSPLEQRMEICGCRQ